VSGAGRPRLPNAEAGVTMRLVPIQCVPLAVALGATLLSGCPEFSGPTGGGTVSDVPCLTPTQWSSDTEAFMHRAESGETDTLLFTTQTEDQFFADIDDGTREFSPHQAVYRFDPKAAEFSLVDDSLWEGADGEICSGCGIFVANGPFAIENGQLLFKGTVVPVAGRRAVRLFDAAVNRCDSEESEWGEVVAVLSIDGYVALLGASTGQHYHQLFSNVDGSQIGPTDRLAIGGLLESTVRACWTSDRKYVVYRQGAQDIPIAGRICVVPVAEAPAGTGQD